MSYQKDTIDWQAITLIDRWLDQQVGQLYKEQPLAQDWARVGKVIEELGEAIKELILYTGQNPRKGIHPEAHLNMLMELADTVATGILAIQHFTKDGWTTRAIIQEKISFIERRMTNELPAED